MSPSCLVIVNGAAGGGKAGRAWPSISAALTQAGVEHTAILTQRPGDATDLCRTALRDGTRTVIAAGGDGTLNEVANGFFVSTDDSTPINPEASLGVLPLGTGSDYARSLKIGRGAAAIPVLAGNTAAHYDIGRVEYTTPNGATVSRYYVNAADLGIGAATAARINRSRKMLGPIGSYLVAAMRSIMAYTPTHVTLTLDDGAPIVGPMSIIVVANQPYFGGGMWIAPPARADDGSFDVLWLAGATRRRLLLDLLPRVYRGAHLQHPAVQHRLANRVTLTAATPLLLEIDGEQVGTAPVTFSIIPRALRVIVPGSR